MKKATPPTQRPKVSKQGNPNNTDNRLFYLLIFAFAFILYGNTLSNRYALDDIYAITGNKFTKEGFSGIPSLLSKDFFAGYYGDQEILLTGGRYRPLSLVSFAVEYQVFGEKPGISHFFNILLYALTACLVFLFLQRLLKEYDKGKWYSSVAFVATLIFIAHPVHTEVVANIKGRDEILSLAGSLAAALCYMNYIRYKKFKYLAYSFICFFLALLSKENAVLFLVLIPLSIYYFREFRLKDNIIAFIPLLTAGILFMMIRFSVVGGLTAPPSTELMDNPFLQADFLQKYATIMFTLGMYIKLLFFPHPLTWDYYPYHIPLVDWTNIWVITSLLIYIFLFVLAVRGILKRSLLSFSIWFYLLSIFLISNIIFQVGVFMAERFLFLPSVAFCLALSWFLVRKAIPFFFRNPVTGKSALQVFLILLLLAFSIKTISRNPDWKDDYTLYTTDVNTSVNSAKSNNIAGQWYAWAANQRENIPQREEFFSRALTHLHKAVTIHPDYQDAWFRLGNVYYDYQKNVDSTLSCYARVLRLNPEEEQVYANLVAVLRQLPDEKQRIAYWERILDLNPARFEPNYYLANLYTQTDLPKAITFMEAASTKKPYDTAILKYLGNAYYNLGNVQKALENYDALFKLSPEDKDVMAKREFLMSRQPGK